MSYIASVSFDLVDLTKACAPLLRPSWQVVREIASLTLESVLVEVAAGPG